MINDTKWYNIFLFVFRFVFTIFIIINILNWKWTNWLVKEEFKKIWRIRYERMCNLKYFVFFPFLFQKQKILLIQIILHSLYTDIRS